MFKAMSLFSTHTKKWTARHGASFLRKSRRLDKAIHESGAIDLESRLDALVSKYDAIRSAYPSLLQECLDDAIKQVESSPLLAARMELRLYLEMVDNARDALREELSGLFTDWTHLDDRMEALALVRGWTDKEFSDGFAELRSAGLNLLQRSAGVLKAADDRWRANYPQLACEQPL